MLLIVQKFILLQNQRQRCMCAGFNVSEAGCDCVATIVDSQTVKDQHHLWALGDVIGNKSNYLTHRECGILLKVYQSFNYLGSAI